jgi:hypothetical protein
MGEKKAVNCLVLCDECSVSRNVELKINQGVKYQNLNCCSLAWLQKKKKKNKMAL